MSNPIPTIKVKGESHDSYVCCMCGKIWKSTANRIGHKKQACDNYYRKNM